MLVVVALHTLVPNLKVSLEPISSLGRRRGTCGFTHVDEGVAFSPGILLSNRVTRRSFLSCRSLASLV
jgi:hypothetical protein